MGWYRNWRLKRRVTVNRLEPREIYERNWPVPEPPEEMVVADSYAATLKQALHQVDSFLFGGLEPCAYCDTRLDQAAATQDIEVTVGRVIVYRDPPPDAKDLKVVRCQGWVADIRHGPRKIVCPRCGHGRSSKAGRWGVCRPEHGNARHGHWV